MDEFQVPTYRVVGIGLGGKRDMLEEGRTFADARKIRQNILRGENYKTVLIEPETASHRQPPPYS
jgi:hypothetical protein